MTHQPPSYLTMLTMMAPLEKVNSSLCCPLYSNFAKQAG